MACISEISVILTVYMSVIFAQNAESKCAYSAMGTIATPLNQCSVYSMEETTSLTYSSDYTYKNGKLEWNYYTNNLECKGESKSYEMDDVMQTIHHLSLQTEGKGSNCNTVDIKVKGSFSQLTDECDTEDTTEDYFSRSYVIDECIPSPDALKEGYSSMLHCNDKEIYFDYYSDCTDCSSCEPERYCYEYYANKDCYSVECPSAQNIDSVICKEKNAQFIKALVTKEANTPIFVPRKGSEVNAMVVNGGVTQEKDMFGLPNDMSVWIYAIEGAFILAVICGICRYIHSFNKEYSRI